MITTECITEAPADTLTGAVAARFKTAESQTIPYEDFTEVVAELLQAFYKPGSILVGAGHVTPDIEIAADRAEVELVEALAVSPFTAEVESVLGAVRSTHDIIYVANPNRVTGANYTAGDLARLAQAVPHGLVIVDENYFDYFGISAVTLVDDLTNVVVLRTFTPAVGLHSIDTGCLVAHPETVTSIKSSCRIRTLTTTARCRILASLDNDKTVASRLRRLHEEALRVTSALTRLGIQCRITPANFVMLRVANPKNVGNFLARYRTPVENLDGYPQLKNYLRYTIQPPPENDRLIEAFQQMPPDFYKMKQIDRRPVTISRRAETTDTNTEKHDSAPQRLNARVKERR
jgi:histidinol-phosphate aminotransferase